MLLNSVHFEYSEFFAHFSARQIEEFISLGEEKDFVAGEIFSLTRHLIFPEIFQGKTNIGVIPHPKFLGVFPFSRFSKIVQLRFQSPSTLYVWKVENLSRFFQKNPILIFPYLHALREKGRVLTNYGIKLLEKNSYIASFVGLDQKSANTTSAWVYARGVKARDETKKVLFIDASLKESSSIFSKLGMELPLPAGFCKEAEGFEFEKRIHTHKISGIDLFNFSVGMKGTIELFLIKNILANAYTLYDTIVIDIPFLSDDRNLSYLIDNSSAIFYPISYSGQNLKFIRYRLKNDLFAGQSYPLAITFRKRYSLRSNLHYIKTDSSLEEDINSYSGEEKISQHLQNCLPPQANSYALSFGSSLLSSFQFLGALQYISVQLAPAKVVAAGWSVFIATLYCLHGNADDVKKIILRLIPEFSARSFFEIVFPKTGLLKSDKLGLLLKRLIGDITFSDLKIPLSLRLFDARRQRVVFVDSGPLLPALLTALRMPGILSKSVSYPGRKQELFGDYFYPENISRSYLQKIGWQKTIHFVASDSISILKKNNVGKGNLNLSDKFEKKWDVFDALMFPYVIDGFRKNAEFALKTSGKRSFYFPCKEYWKNYENIPAIIEEGYSHMENCTHYDKSYILGFLKNN